jgi:hypothetical protein
MSLDAVRLPQAVTATSVPARKGRVAHGKGYGHAAQSPEVFKKRFCASLALIIPVLMYSYSHHI